MSIIFFVNKESNLCFVRKFVLLAPAFSSNSLYDIVGEERGRITGTKPDIP